MDWTRNNAGAANSSEAFLRAVAAVATLLRNGAFDLIQGRADTVAGLVIASLAHEHGFIPAASYREELVLSFYKQFALHIEPQQALREACRAADEFLLWKNSDSSRPVVFKAIRVDEKGETDVTSEFQKRNCPEV